MNIVDTPGVGNGQPSATEYFGPGIKKVRGAFASAPTVRAATS
jgi:hypothetical protein